MARIFHHTIPIIGHLVVKGERGDKLQIKIVIVAAEDQQENKEWLPIVSGMLAAKSLEITNLQEIYTRGDQEIVLEQRECD